MLTTDDFKFEKLESPSGIISISVTLSVVREELFDEVQASRAKIDLCAEVCKVLAENIWDYIYGDIAFALERIQFDLAYYNPQPIPFAISDAISNLRVRLSKPQPAESKPAA